MELLAAGFSLSSLPSIIYTALGLGFVIFVHELGHFAVAKWCGVRVERFSIGFGPVILSFMKGETEYALSIIPFGGYVKMLGQDDIDPNQMASEQVARDPRSYTAKTVLQRMAIISAGVIMNLITGTMMFCGAFMMGLDSVPSTIGAVSPGSPAWVAGIQPGDNIYNIDGYRIVTFSDIMRRVTLSWEKVELSGKHHDGTDYHETIIPFKSKDDNRSAIGVTKANSLRIVDSPNELIQHVFTGTAAAKATPEFKPGDLVKSVNGKPVKDHFEYRQALLEKSNESLDVVVERAIGKEPGKTEEVKIKVEANPVRTLGLLMDIGQISAIRKGSPAEGKLQKGDKITELETADGKTQAIGREIDPLRLPQILGELHGQEVTLTVKRERQGADPEPLKITLTPENRPGWSEFPFDDDAAMSIPSIGITCFVLHSVISVDPKGAAEGLVKPKDQIKKAELILPAGVKSDSHGDKPIVLDFDNGKRSWPYLFWTMQECPLRKVKLTVASQGAARTVELTPAPAENWFTVERGIHFEFLVDFHRDTNLSVAMGRAVAETRNFMGEIYLILYNLGTGRLSVTQMHGPIGIVNAAVQISDQGFAPLLFFLAYLSINLAVLNFLPIPVLDGGHMAFLLYEGIRGKPPSERILIILTWIGLAMIGSLMVTVLGLDILRAFGFRK
ncbi:MAG: peptidase [Planctomycetaceae bacterium]|nr:peptidase [Planctomycetaceae bacterium]